MSAFAYSACRPVKRRPLSVAEGLKGQSAGGSDGHTPSGPIAGIRRRGVVRALLDSAQALVFFLQGRLVAQARMDEDAILERERLARLERQRFGKQQRRPEVRQARVVRQVPVRGVAGIGRGDRRSSCPPGPPSRSSRRRRR